MVHPAFLFVLTRPILLPAAVLASGVAYGFYDLTLLTTRFVLDRKRGEPVPVSVSASGIVLGGGVAFIRNRLHPYKSEQAELVSNLSFSKVFSTHAKRVARYHFVTLALFGLSNGIWAGMNSTSASEKSKKKDA